jgi:hexosaminidase
METFTLIPYPRHMSPLPGFFAFSDHHFIAIDSPDPLKLYLSGRKLQETLNSLGINNEIIAGCHAGEDQNDIILRKLTDSTLPPQGYQLEIGPKGVVIESPDEAGIFYGVCTLQQLLAYKRPASLPCMTIIDWPDFPARGVMLDISRDKVYTLKTLISLIDKLASWKINQLQLYTEHTFAYRRHPDVWAKASPFTGDDILRLDAYCKDRFIDLVPNQNSFGHMHRWFSHPEYYPLGELAGVEDQKWWGRGSFSLCPGDPRSLALIKSLYDELLPHFSSQLFNVGCDETFDLGLGRSKGDCDTRGKGRVYLDFLLKIYNLVKSHNRTMQFWGDIIIQYPDLVPELPRDAIALEWGYEAGNPPAENCEKFSSAGIPFYVCPGTSSWNSIAGRTDNALGNLRTAAQNGLKYGAIGFLNTDWGDNGHWQVLPVSYLGFAVGAAYAWNYQANQPIDIPRALSLHAFQDSSYSLGQVAYDLGNVYQSVGYIPGNSSALFHILQMPFSEIRKYADRFDPNGLTHVLEFIDQAVKPLTLANSEAPDAALLVKEFEYTARKLRHACRRGMLAFGIGDQSPAVLDLDLREIMIEYQNLWLARNRPGGLVDSLARFEKARQDYMGSEN